MTISCICPCNEVDRDGPCCCGCVSPASSTKAVTACPHGDALNEEHRQPPLRPLPTGELRYIYPRLIELGALEDEATEWGDAKAVLDANEVKYDGSLFPGGKPFGALCEKNSDCEFGICGKGCDCDSSIEKTCSCNCQSYFPVQVCGGCNRGKGDKGRVIGPCPKGVGIEQVGRTQVWIPSSPTAKVSPQFCTVVELMIRDPKWKHAMPFYPEACKVGGNAKVAQLFNGTDYNNHDDVERLYKSLENLLCSWKTPSGELLNECHELD